MRRRRFREIRGPREQLRCFSASAPRCIGRVEPSPAKNLYIYIMPAFRNLNFDDICVRRRRDAALIIPSFRPSWIYDYI